MKINEELFKAALRNAVKQEMSEIDKQTIRKLQGDLQRIDRGDRFFFNIAQFKKLGLIKERDIYKTDPYGNKVRVRSDYSLTDKARQYLNVVV